MTSTTEKLLTVTLFGIKVGMTETSGRRAPKRKRWYTVGIDHSDITGICWKGNRGKYITLIGS
jgi:hypothetical protein